MGRIAETVQQRLHRLAAERQAVVVQQMEVAQSLEEKRRQLSAAPPNPIIRGRIQTAVTELEAQHASLQEQIAAIDARISAMKHA